MSRSSGDRRLAAIRILRFEGRARLLPGFCFFAVLTAYMGGSLTEAMSSYEYYERQLALDKLVHLEQLCRELAAGARLCRGTCLH